MNRCALLLLLFAGCSAGTGDAPTGPQESAETLLNRAQQRIDAKDFDAALADLNELVAREPERAAALTLRGSVYRARREYALAVLDLERAVYLDSKSSAAANDLGWILATCPDDQVRSGRRAVQVAKIALIRIADNWRTLDTYAAALAENGDFAEAVKYQSLLLRNPPPEHAGELEKRLASYQAGKPWRE